MIVEWPKPAAISNFPRFVDNVDALGPSAIGEIGRIAHVVHAERKREVESTREIIGNGHTLRQGLRLRVANTLVHVGFHLPFVLRVCLANIHGQKLGAIFVIVVQIYEVAYLAAERRSGVASENENKRLLADAIAQMKDCLSVERQQWNIRGAVSHVQVPPMPLWQRIAKKPVNVTRPAHQIA